MSTETYDPVGNGLHAPPLSENHFPPDVPFGPRPNHVIPFDWAVWILTSMRNDEIANAKPRKFSDWIKAASLEDL